MNKETRVYSKNGEHIVVYHDNGWPDVDYFYLNLDEDFVEKVERAQNLHDLLVAKGIIGENKVNEFVEARKVLNKLIE